MDLFIDDTRFSLGDPVEPAALNSGRFHKQGLVRRLLTGQDKNQVRYTADNLTLTGIDRDFSIYPCPHAYLDEDRKWSTRVTLVVQEGILHEILFQVLDGRYAAPTFFERFSDACRAVLGDPVRHEPESLSWRHQDYTLSAHLLDGGFRSDFLFRWDVDRPGTLP